MLINRIKSNKGYCIKFALKWTCGVFSLWSIISLVAPCENLFKESTSFLTKLFIAIGIIIGVFVVMYVFGVFAVLRVNSIALMDVGDNHHIYVQYGDVFSSDILCEKTKFEKRNILISVNRCFDTIIDDDLITTQSLHGIAMNNIYAKTDFNQESLNNEIQKKIKNYSYDIVERKNKPKGNLKRYEAGAIAEVSIIPEITYFFLGLTSLDKKLHASVTNMDYLNSINKALKYCIQRNQGYPVIIPLIGGGRANSNKDEKDILDYLIKLILLHKQSINCDIHIVVRNSAKDKIAITEYK